MSGFQREVHSWQAMGVEGDRASTHIEVFAIAGPGQLFTGDDKVKVGNFAYLQNCYVTGAKPVADYSQVVFVLRQNNTTVLYGEEGSLMLLENRPVSAMVEGEFLARFADGATVGKKVFASETDGSVKADIAGAKVAGYTETGFIVRTAANAGELAKISSWGV